MNCQQINKEEWHEQYLLGRLTPDQKSVYEQHINHCQKCSDELQVQKQFITGIRNSGRMAMKEEIKEQANQIRENSRSEFKYVVLRAAAVLMIAAFIPGLYYYYNNIINLEDMNESPVIGSFEQTEEIAEEEAEGIEQALTVDEDAEMLVPPKSEARKEREKKSITQITKSTDAVGVLSEADQIKQLEGKGISSSGAGVTIGDAEYVSGVGELIEISPEMVESVVLDEMPTAGMQKPMAAEKSQFSKDSRATKRISSLEKTALHATEQPRRLEIRYPKGILELIADEYPDRIPSDSIYYFVKKDSLIRIYWPDIPREFTYKSEYLVVTQEDSGKLILVYDDKIIYQINLTEQGAYIKRLQ